MGVAKLLGSEKLLEIIKKGQWAKAAASAALNNVGSYAANRIVGNDAHFSWRSVAASAVTAAITASVAPKISEAFGKSAGTRLGQFGIDAATGMVGGVVSLHVRRAFGFDDPVNYGSIAADAFGNALARQFTGEAAAAAFKYRHDHPLMPSKGNGILAGKNERNKKLLKDRGIEYAELPNGDLYFASIDRGGEFARVDGSEVVQQKAYRNEDGSISYVSPDENGNYALPDGVKTVDVKELRYGGKSLGRDFGTPEEWLEAIRQSGVTAGDPANSLRRQVAVDTTAHPELAGYIDPSTGQVNPLQWDDFQAATMKAGLSLMVASNGLGNWYQQARDNIRLLSIGEDKVAVNVYNPTIDGKFVKDIVAECALANLLGQNQTVQVAIQAEMGAALDYNKNLDFVQNRKAGTTLTDFVGHSQGTINGNLAIDRMSAEQKKLINVFDIGVASWHLPHGVASFTSIADQHDLVSILTFGRAISGDEYAQDHPETYKVVNTHIDQLPGVQDRTIDPGIHHSFYLYVQTPEFQNALGFKTVPSLVTRPF
jgi:hypothetical protein